MIGSSLGPFWEDFKAVWESFWEPKVRKRGPKSIPKIIQFLMSNFHDFYWFLVGLLSQKPLKTVCFCMVSCNSCFCHKLDLGIKQVRFWELKIVLNRSSGVTIRVQKSIRILGRKKEGPKSKKGPPKSKCHALSIAILEPRGPWERHIKRPNNPNQSLVISQRLWAKARRIGVGGWPSPISQQ